MIGIMTVSHKRPKIDEAWCLMIERIRIDYPGIFMPLVAVSLEEDRKVFEGHGIETYIYPNLPVSEKNNFIFSKAKGRFDNVVFLGSDNIMDNNYIDELLRNTDKDIAWGIGICFYSAQKQKARFWDDTYRHVAGPGKLISARLLDKVDWVPYKLRMNNNLDHNSWDVLSPFIQSKYTFKVKEIRGLLMDIKSEVNINSYHGFENNGSDADLDNIYKKLSGREVEYLKSLN